MVDPVTPPGAAPVTAPAAPASPAPSAPPPAVPPSQAPSPNQAGSTALNPGSGNSPDARAPHKGDGPRRSSVITNPTREGDEVAEAPKKVDENYISEATKAEMEAGKKALGRHAPAKED